jgi:acyl-CoA hydrolase
MGAFARQLAIRPGLRADTDVVVTEFGAAELKGRTISERVKKMIEIAHPDFREELATFAYNKIAGLRR